MSVYFLDCPAVNRIKIGTAISPEQRIETIRLMCPVETTIIGVIPGGFAEEQELHRQFAHLRRYGEWFDGTEELRRAIWVMCINSLWDAGKPEWRAQFVEQMNAPIEWLARRLDVTEMHDLGEMLAGLCDPLSKALMREAA